MHNKKRSYNDTRENAHIFRVSLQRTIQIYVEYFYSYKSLKNFIKKIQPLKKNLSKHTNFLSKQEKSNNGFISK